MQKHRNILVLVLILIISLSCRFLIPEQTPTPIHVTKPPVQTASAAVTIPVLTSTPLAPTVTPAPTSLNETGPYIVYGGEGGIWISNPDGSFLTKITDLPIDLDDLHRAISPSGDRMALIVSNDAGLDLVEVKIPSGATKLIAHLLSITRDELISYPTNMKSFAAYAIRDYDNVAWQPGEGQLLAFMGGINGPTSDLYLYDTESGEISQLTSGLSQGVFPNWSPDGKYILHYGVSWKGPFGGAIIGHDHLDGVWAVRAADGEVITLPTPKSVSFNFVGWQDEGHYITYDSGDDCARNLRSVDVVTGKATPIMQPSFYYYIARSPENGALLFSGAEGCADSPGEGIFLLVPGETRPAQLADKRAWEVDWMPEDSVFHAYPEALFSTDGSTRYDPPVYDKSFQPAVSQNGYQAWEVIENQKGRVEVKVPGADWQTILDGSVEELIWDPATGETLLIVLRDGSLYAASYPEFARRQIGNVDGVRQVIWLP
jgi:hypothetical protein